MSYPEFYWLRKWMDFAETIESPAERCEFNLAIAKYGLSCEEPTMLKGTIANYFNSVVRPELNRQHAKYDGK